MCPVQGGEVCVCPVQSGEGGDEGACVPCAEWGGWCMCALCRVRVVMRVHVCPVQGGEGGDEGESVTMEQKVCELLKDQQTVSQACMYHYMPYFLLPMPHPLTHPSAGVTGGPEAATAL